MVVVVEGRGFVVVEVTLVVVVGREVVVVGREVMGVVDMVVGEVVEKGHWKGC